ncbi:MAG: threonine/serine exporter family protein [Planctomycetota bacterium]
MNATSPSEDPKHAFLLRAGELLHRYGTPSFRFEGVMDKIAGSLGVPATFLYTPTSLIVEFGIGASARTRVLRIESTDTDISKLLAIDSVLERVEARSIDLTTAIQELERIDNSGAPFSATVQLVAATGVSAGLATLFGGGAMEAFVTGLFGLLTGLFVMRRARTPQPGLFEPMIGFVVAFAAVCLAHWININDRLVTLAVLILPIPGLALTIALTELALGHLASGSARLAGAMVKLFTLVVGVALAWRITETWAGPVPPPLEPPSAFVLWLVIAMSSVAFAILFKAPVSEWIAIVMVVIAGFIASRIVSALAGVELASFAGAFAVGCGSNAYARLRNRPAMIPQTPGLLILVPGSIGYRSLTAMVEHDMMLGVELAFSMSIVGVALVGGLLFANLVISPKRLL